jgi:putative transposase
MKNRKTLPHGIPSWVADDAEYFITLCTQPRKKNQLCHAEMADALIQTLTFYQNRGDLWVHLLVLMPDHLHAIMGFSRDVGMQKSMREFKKYTARMYNISWQRDFFDHRLRQDESYVEKAHYIRMNPVRAGLCKRPEDWPYVWENLTW